MCEILHVYSAYILLPEQIFLSPNDFIAFNFWQSRIFKANYTLTACKFDDADSNGVGIQFCELHEWEWKSAQHKLLHKWKRQRGKGGKVSIKGKHYSSMWLPANVYGLNWGKQQEKESK